MDTLYSSLSNTFVPAVYNPSSPRVFTYYLKGAGKSWLEFAAQARTHTNTRRAAHLDSGFRWQREGRHWASWLVRQAILVSHGFDWEILLQWITWEGDWVWFPTLTLDFQTLAYRWTHTPLYWHPYVWKICIHTHTQTTRPYPFKDKSREKKISLRTTPVLIPSLHPDLDTQDVLKHIHAHAIVVVKGILMKAFARF